MNNIKKLIQIKDVPYIYIDEYNILNGELDEVCEKIKELKVKLKEAFILREKNIPNEKFTPFDDYKIIRLRTDSYHDSLEMKIDVFREESDDEFNKRIERNNNIKKSLKDSAQRRNIKKDEEEFKLYQKLKEKYEK
jgi:hypothetical protein